MVRPRGDSHQRDERDNDCRRHARDEEATHSPVPNPKRARSQC
jgi:hypothetical protein